MKDAEYLQNSKQFADVCSKALNEPMNINKDLTLQDIKTDVEETETVEGSTDEYLCFILGLRTVIYFESYIFI